MNVCTPTILSIFTELATTFCSVDGYIAGKCISIGVHFATLAVMVRSQL